VPSYRKESWIGKISSRNKLKTPFALNKAQEHMKARKNFFLDNDGILYKRRSNGNHQLVVPQSLILEVIKENHDPVFVAHPGVKRTKDLILLRYWWPGMRRSVEEYIQKCDLCQKRKEDREFRAPLAEVEMPTTPFEVTSMDITGPCPVTPRGNKY
jgi:hypothetical protein